MVRKTATARETGAKVYELNKWIEEEMRFAAQKYHDDRYREFWEACQPPKPGWFRRTFLNG